MNNILYIKKLKPFKRFPDIKHDDMMDAFESEKEVKSFNKFMWYYLKMIFITVFSIGAIVWVVEAMGCEPTETETVDIRVINL
jgi:hypothetical protein